MTYRPRRIKAGDKARLIAANLTLWTAVGFGAVLTMTYA